jgi:hypothetical protein
MSAQLSHFGVEQVGPEEYTSIYGKHCSGVDPGLQTKAISPDATPLAASVQLKLTCVVMPKIQRTMFIGHVQ